MRELRKVDTGRRDTDGLSEVVRVEEREVVSRSKMMNRD